MSTQLKSGNKTKSGKSRSPSPSGSSGKSSGKSTSKSPKRTASKSRSPSPSGGKKAFNQVEAFNTFVEAFLEKHGDSKMIKAWQNEKNQEAAIKKNQTQIPKR